MSEPIFFIFGCAGVGKTTIANLLELREGFVHINFDPAFENGTFPDGIKREGMSEEWKNVGQNPQGLVNKIREKIAANGSAGACVTFKSNVYLFHRELLEAFVSTGIQYVVLCGLEEKVFEAFFNRQDGLTKEQKNRESWSRTNGFWLKEETLQKYQNNVVNVFNESGERRLTEEILSDVCKLLPIRS